MSATAEELTSLAGTYRLLARLWIREVDEPFLEFLTTPPIRDVFTAAGGMLPKNVVPATLEELAVDYCQLFLGPTKHLPPFQSVWQDARFQGKAAASMQSYVAATDRQTGGLMLDHLGVQFDVMASLLDHVLESDRDRDESLELVATYFAQHLTWLSPLLQAASHRAKTDFYRSVITMTRDFLNAEEIFWAAAHRIE